MPQTKCPHCSEPVSVPEDADPASRVDCPSCLGQFAAADASTAATDCETITTDDTPAGGADELGFLQVVTGQVPPAEATATDHLAFLQSPAAPLSSAAELASPESPAALAADSPSHATTYRELFGVDPPTDESPCDRPSAMAAYDFDFLANSGLVPAPGEISEEPPTLDSVVVPGFVEITTEADAAPAATAPTEVSEDGVQEPTASIDANTDAPPLEASTITVLVVEPAPSADLVESAIAPAQPVAPESAAAEPNVITPQRSFFQFGMAAAAPEAVVPAEVAVAVVAEPVVASAEPQAAAPEVATAATTVEVPAVESDDYPFVAETEVAEEDDAFATEEEEFADLSSERPSDEAAVVISRERLPRRKQKSGHPIRNFVGLSLGAFCGMFLAYSLLCLIFGAEIDALHIYYKQPERATSRRTDSSANSQSGQQKSAFELLEDQREAKKPKQ